MELKDWPTDKLVWYKNKLQQEFDELWDAQRDPLIMRHIGCTILHIIQILKERGYDSSNLQSRRDNV